MCHKCMFRAACVCFVLLLIQVFVVYSMITKHTYNVNAFLYKYKRQFRPYTRHYIAQTISSSYSLQQQHEYGTRSLIKLNNDVSSCIYMSCCTMRRCRSHKMCCNIGSCENTPVNICTRRVLSYKYVWTFTLHFIKHMTNYKSKCPQSLNTQPIWRTPVFSNI